MKPMHNTPSALAPLAMAVFLAGCATVAEPPPTPRKEMVLAVTDKAELIEFNAGQPQKVLRRVPLQGLASSDRLVGIDFRVARGTLYALSARGRLYTLDPATGRLSTVGAGATMALTGTRFGVDFNPVADRIRVVSDSGLNLRLHPDTAGVAAADPPLQYDAADVARGGTPQVVAAGYTYNQRNDRLTTNYAIDTARGTLLTQGTQEDVPAAVSPNTGRLYTVGEMGTGPLQEASLDIADTNNAALAALRQGNRTRLYALNLATGRATLLGTVGSGDALWGLAIQP